jgi:NDP-sugar pyrophosphorylase family protein
MQFAIIAAGEGSRFKEEGIVVPKPLVQVAGRPMIEHILEYALMSGADGIHCIINEQSPELRDYIDSQRHLYPVNLLVKSTPSSMHSLYELSPYLRHDSFCLCTTDTIFAENEFRSFIEQSKKLKDVSGSIAVTGYIEDEKPLYVKTDDGFISEFSDENRSYELVTGGLYFFKPDIFNTLDKAVSSGIVRLRNFLKLLLQDGFKLRAYEFSKMIDVDHKKDIESAEEFLNKIEKETYTK